MLQVGRQSKKPVQYRTGFLLSQYIKNQIGSLDAEVVVVVVVVGCTGLPRHIHRPLLPDHRYLDLPRIGHLCLNLLGNIKRQAFAFLSVTLSASTITRSSRPAWMA
jgi:hypothetical protein